MRILHNFQKHLFLRNLQMLLSKQRVQIMRDVIHVFFGITRATQIILVEISSDMISSLIVDDTNQLFKQQDSCSGKTKYASLEMKLRLILFAFWFQGKESHPVGIIQLNLLTFSCNEGCFKF